MPYLDPGYAAHLLLQVKVEGGLQLVAHFLCNRRPHTLPTEHRPKPLHKLYATAMMTVQPRLKVLLCALEVHLSLRYLPHEVAGHVPMVTHKAQICRHSTVQSFHLNMILQ